jgi:hypothetical protein
MSDLRRAQGPRRSLRHLRRLAALVFLCSLALGPSPRGAWAAELGTIEGKVMNAHTKQGQPGVRVTLVGGRADDAGGVSEALTRSAQTDARGRFVFDKLPTGDDRPYLLDATYSGGLFTGGAITLPGDSAAPPVIDSTLRVWPTTTDPDVIVIERDDLFVIKGEDQTVDVIESLQIVNLSRRAYIGRGGAVGAGNGPRPTLGFSIPAASLSGGIQILDASIDAPQLIRTSTGPAITSAIPPRTMNISFVYGMRASAGRVDLSRKAFYPTLNLSVYTEDPFIVEGSALEEKDDQTIGGRRYRVWSASRGVDPGATIEIVATAEAGSDPVLVVGSALLAVMVVGGVAFALLKRRGAARRAPVTAADGGAPVASRDELMVAIAELDLRYRAGDLAEREWIEQRKKLKAGVARLPRQNDAGHGHHESPEPAS